MWVGKLSEETSCFANYLIQPALKTNKTKPTKCCYVSGLDNINRITSHDCTTNKNPRKMYGEIFLNKKLSREYDCLANIGTKEASILLLGK